MTFRDDDGGAFQAFEAILVAIMIGSAILFVVATSNPVLETTAAGIDLSPEAQEAAIQMTTTYRADFDAALNASLQGQPADAAWASLVGQVLDDDFRYAVQINNGVGTFQVLPTPGTVLSSPRGAVHGTAYIRADWIGPEDLGLDSFAAGAEWTGAPLVDADLLRYHWYDGSTYTPSNTGPGQQKWLDIWAGLEPTLEDVPLGAPLGKWDYDGDEFWVTSVAGIPHVEYPTMAVQFLIWDGAA